ncbi:hypothetical protein D3C78_1532880 [compost metagenome]
MKGDDNIRALSEQMERRPKDEIIQDRTTSHSLCTTGGWTASDLNLFFKDKNRGMGNGVIKLLI